MRIEHLHYATVLTRGVKLRSEKQGLFEHAAICQLSRRHNTREVEISPSRRAR